MVMAPSRMDLTKCRRKSNPSHPLLRQGVVFFCYLNKFLPDPGLTSGMINVCLMEALRWVNGDTV